ncbi:hypothetical protein EDC01DRAFT_732392 [Geopyxis carbonaria]|nr:hypothetical protein EDC01DRAFT_732392 [Geopyxis carbonaria]
MPLSTRSLGYRAIRRATADPWPGAEWEAAKLKTDKWYRSKVAASVNTIIAVNVVVFSVIVFLIVFSIRRSKAARRKMEQEGEKEQEEDGEEDGLLPSYLESVGHVREGVCEHCGHGEQKEEVKENHDGFEVQELS